MLPLATESGEIITIQSGIPIGVDTPTNNNDIQLLDFSVNLLQAILWQYQNATNLQSILQQKQEWYNCNQTEFWKNWIINVFNLATANEFGLTVWSIILNLPLFVNQPPTPSGAVSFGFGTGNGNFGNSNFGTATGGTINLSLAVKRIALQLRYFQLCSSGTVPEINRFLKYLFASYGNAYVIDNHDMTQIYVFDFPLSSDLIYLFENIDILPRPAGVKNLFYSAVINTFGFGPLRLNFGNSNFGGF